MAPWTVWILFTLIIIVVETIGRYFAFKYEPRAWSAQTTAVRAIIWAVAWLIIAHYSWQGLSVQAVLQSLCFGVIYFGVVYVVGRAVRQRAQPRG